MGTLKQESQQASENWEDENDETDENDENDESLQEAQETDQETESDEAERVEETVKQKPKKNLKKNERKRAGTVQDNGSFGHGVAAGLGIGCIAAFIIMWMTVVFTPRLPSGITYENMLATFIYPLLYLLGLGLIALTVGIVRQYYAVKTNA